MNLTIDKIALLLGMSLMLIGLWGGFTQKNLLKIILSFSIFDTGLNILIVALGYLPGRTAPIIDGSAVTPENLALVAIDPVPQALVLTAIVIGFGTTALLLAYALKLNQHKKSLDINQFTDLKW
ncbi:MAG: cation:proton antiporter subunit C [Bacteroidales bacterium]|jgi:multicomponent Na+:H+ antiporter subunit C|nr:cation:proton antiporter subunit C [Bacteroidales bacterium]